jgi:hypothetical protein
VSLKLIFLVVSRAVSVLELASAESFWAASTDLKVAIIVSICGDAQPLDFEPQVRDDRTVAAGSAGVWSS